MLKKGALEERQAVLPASGARKKGWVGRKAFSLQNMARREAATSRGKLGGTRIFAVFTAMPN
jgi:hypothetical protein